MYIYIYAYIYINIYIYMYNIMCIYIICVPMSTRSNSITGRLIWFDLYFTGAYQCAGTETKCAAYLLLVDNGTNIHSNCSANLKCGLNCSLNLNLRTCSLFGNIFEPSHPKDSLEIGFNLLRFHCQHVGENMTLATHPPNHFTATCPAPGVLGDHCASCRSTDHWWWHRTLAVH